MRTHFTFVIQTIGGQSYSVPSCTDLKSTNWSVCTNVIGDGSLLRSQLPATTQPQDFYLVRQP